MGKEATINASLLSKAPNVSEKHRKEKKSRRDSDRKEKRRRRGEEDAETQERQPLPQPSPPLSVGVETDTSSQGTDECRTRPNSGTAPLRSALRIAGSTSSATRSLSFAATD